MLWSNEQLADSTRRNFAFLRPDDVVRDFHTIIWNVNWIERLKVVALGSCKYRTPSNPRLRGFKLFQISASSRLAVAINFIVILTLPDLTCWAKPDHPRPAQPRLRQTWGTDRTKPQDPPVPVITPRPPPLSRSSPQDLLPCPGHHPDIKWSVSGKTCLFKFNVKYESFVESLLRNEILQLFCST